MWSALNTFYTNLVRFERVLYKFGAFCTHFVQTWHTAQIWWDSTLGFCKCGAFWARFVQNCHLFGRFGTFYACLAQICALYSHLQKFDAFCDYVAHVLFILRKFVLFVQIWWILHKLMHFVHIGCNLVQFEELWCIFSMFCKYLVRFALYCASLVLLMQL